MNEDDEHFIRACSVKSLCKMLKKFQPEDFDKIYMAVLQKYNRHYAPYSKPSQRKKNWSAPL
jgi:hypothetical protein